MERALREAVWVRSGGRCERLRAGVRCNRPVSRANWEGHVHHVVYSGHGLERLEDLLLVCLECHGVEHPHRTFLTREQQEARRNLRLRRRALELDAGLTRSESRALARGWAWRPPE